MELPIIHTNIWDAVIAVPIIIVVVQALKILLKIPKFLIPTLANVIALIISIFISHKDHLAAGIFMGLFYGNAAVGVYASMKTTLIAFLNKKSNQHG